MRTEVTAIWQTEESPSEARTVFDELEHTLFFLTDVIYRVIPPFYEAMEAALRGAYGAAAAAGAARHRPLRLVDRRRHGRQPGHHGAHASARRWPGSAR